VNSRESTTEQKGRKRKQRKNSRKIHLGDMGEALVEEDRRKQQEGNRT